MDEVIEKAELSEDTAKFAQVSDEQIIEDEVHDLKEEYQPSKKVIQWKDALQKSLDTAPHVIRVAFVLALILAFTPIAGMLLAVAFALLIVRGLSYLSLHFRIRIFGIWVSLTGIFCLMWFFSYLSIVDAIIRGHADAFQSEMFWYSNVFFVLILVAKFVLNRGPRALVAFIKNVYLFLFNQFKQALKDPE